MNLSTICDEISYLANDTSLGSAGEHYTRTKAWVREAYFLDILSLRSDWWFLKANGTISTVNGTAVYTLPLTSPNVKQIREITVGGSGLIDGIDSFQGSDFSDTIKGQPSKYWHYDRSSGMDRIKLYPIPDAVYTLNVVGIATPSSLTEDADIPTLPSEWHYLLVKGGFIKALKHNQDPNLELEVQEYQTALRRLVAQNNRDDYRTDSWWK